MFSASFARLVTSAGGVPYLMVAIGYIPEMNENLDLFPIKSRLLLFFLNAALIVQEEKHGCQSLEVSHLSLCQNVLRRYIQVFVRTS